MVVLTEGTTQHRPADVHKLMQLQKLNMYLYPTWVLNKDDVCGVKILTNVSQSNESKQF